MLKRIGLIALALMSFNQVQAADDGIAEKLQALMPGMDVNDVKEIGQTGMYEAVVNGDIIYFSKDLHYAFKGDVVDIASRENITEVKRLDLRKTALDAVNEADLIVYKPENAQHTITVFTDIDCGYCRKLHQQIDEYNEQGISVRYMAFPRAGIDSDSYDKAEQVWCSKDRKQAMTEAKQGKDLKVATCDTPVKAQYELGQSIGVEGTPAIFLENGQLIPGYVPPARLKQILDQQS